MFESMESEITSYLQNKYKAQSIILHGSRALGIHRKNSDWDILVLVEENISGKRNIREMFKGQHIDAFLLSYPIENANFEKIVSVSHGIRVLFDNEEQIGSQIVQKALGGRELGCRLSFKDKTKTFEEMLKYYLRLHDNLDRNMIFFHRLGRDFFPQAINNWFRIIKNEYSLPPYLAIDRIREEDIGYYRLLKVLSSGKKKRKKLRAAKEIIERLKSQLG